MMVPEDQGSPEYFAYHRDRAEQERRRAEAASDPAAKRSHSELAERHEALANGEDLGMHTMSRPI